MKSFFYLHYGPGGNAQVERSWPQFPSSIFLWDQPFCSRYDELVSATVDQVKTQMTGPIRLMGHSFGCNLALSVAPFLSVDELVLLSPLPSLPKAFYNFACKILNSKSLGIDYRNKLEELCSQFSLHNKDSFWRLVECVACYEHFQDMYWFNCQAQVQYMSLLKNTTPLNYDMWKAVLEDYLSLPQLAIPKSVSRVKVVLGAHDPYVHIEEDVAYWKQYAPGVLIETVEAAHFPQFETHWLTVNAVK